MKEELAKKIEIATAKAKDDAEKDIIFFIKTLEENHEKQEIYIYKLIIEVKNNYLKTLGSYYYLIGMIEPISNNTDSQTLLDKIIAFNDAKNKFLPKNYNLTLKIDSYVNEVYRCTKAYALYSRMSSFIQLINNNLETNFKIEDIDDFELFIFNKYKASEIELNSLKKEFRTLQIDNFNYKNSLSKLKDNNEQLNSDKNYIQRSLDSKQFIIDAIYLPELNKKAAANILQFTDTIWGDNYPALKVLYSFLMKYELIDYSWSQFADLMGINNNEYLYFSSLSLNKKLIGYLLFSLKPFFLPSYTIKPKTYNNWLRKKIIIDTNYLSDKYITNYINRSAINDKNIDKSQLVIDELVQKIHKRYIR